MTLVEKIFSDAAACSFTMGTFLSVETECIVCAKPDLRGAVLWCSCDERDVDDKSKGMVWVCKVCV